MTSYSRSPAATSIGIDEWVGASPQRNLFALINYESLNEELRRELLDVGAVNLYDDLKGTAIADSGPRLWEINQFRKSQFIERCIDGYPASLLVGSCGLGELARHLQDIREVLVPDDVRALFRYHDINVIRAIFPILSATQVDSILGPLFAWGGIDSCGVFHALSSSDQKRKSGELSFDRKQINALDEALFIHAVESQIRDTDSTLLNNLTPCEIELKISELIKKAEAFGLKQASDKSLYCVLSFQFPEGFEKESPFVEAINYRAHGAASFGDYLDRVASKEWDKWDDCFINE